MIGSVDLRDALFDRLHPLEDGRGHQTYLGGEQEHARHQRAVPFPPEQIDEQVGPRHHEGDEPEQVSEAPEHHASSPPATIPTSPADPSIESLVPGAKRVTASGTSTTVGTPNSRARIARCERTLPVSATRPESRGSIDRKSVV